ncbi:uncharacterized protein LOC106672323 [Cimex lectularius]|uniref:CHK kinase-like domain-containing protein n=1 Tax=Cimex lectularius TaxID=79782 RepID=A0A8I6TK63_CIMLE|nr:uncharacterized protein LOC106672323 [Cimex lectularius]
MDSIKKVIQLIVDDGVFGPVKLKSVNFREKDEAHVSHFASSIVGVAVTVENDSSECIHRLIVKLPVNSDLIKELLMSDVLFKNEVLMYEELLPLLKAQELDVFPKMYYGNFTEGKETSRDMIILEDLSPGGFTLTEEKVFMDFNHFSLALEKLGRFHALSHKTKRENAQEFRRLYGQLSKSKFENEKVPDIQKISCTAMQRGIKHVMEKGDKLELLNQLLEKTNGLKAMVEKLFEPEEPFAVLCHGDFNRNNVFFKYENGKPVDVKFFDLQTPRYTTPSLDLAFILYMNTTKELREKHWDDMLRCYWDGFTAVLTELPFDFDQFHRHFAKTAIYGYIPCSFFLPYMMEPNPLPLQSMENLDTEAKVKMMMAIGGETATETIGDVVQHLLDKGYIEAFLHLYD